MYKAICSLCGTIASSGSSKAALIHLIRHMESFPKHIGKYRCWVNNQGDFYFMYMGVQEDGHVSYNTYGGIDKKKIDILVRAVVADLVTEMCKSNSLY